MATHPSHKTRSSDSSFYDLVCLDCELTDFANHLSQPCLGNPEAARIAILKQTIAEKEKDLAEYKNNLAKLEAKQEPDRYLEAGVPIGDSGFFYEKGVFRSVQLTKGDGKTGSSIWLDLLTDGGEVRWRKG